MGTDLVAFPQHDKPDNCTFEVADAEDEWKPRDKFDFIFMRYISFFANHGRIFDSMYENLKPGGWVEIQEWIVHIESSNGWGDKKTKLQTWNRLFIRGKY